MTANDANSPSPPDARPSSSPSSRRTAASLIDKAVILLVGTFPLWFLEILGRTLPSVPVWPLFPPFLVPFFLAFALFYVLILEGLWAGRTVGKAVMGLRVARADGGGIGLRESLVRNLARLIDGFPFGLYLVGLALLAFRGRRLGDLLAGTTVQRERRPLRAGAGKALAGFLALVALPNLLWPAMLWERPAERPHGEFLRGMVVSRHPDTPAGIAAMLDRLEEAGFNALRVHSVRHPTFPLLAREAQARGLALIGGVGGGWSRRATPQEAVELVQAHRSLAGVRYWCVGNEDYATDLSVPRAHLLELHRAVAATRAGPTIFANHMVLHAPDLLVLRARGFGPIDFTDALGFNAYPPGLAFSWDDLVGMWCRETATPGVRGFARLYAWVHKRLAKRVRGSCFGFPYLLWSYAAYGRLKGRAVILTEFGGTRDLESVSGQLEIVARFAGSLDGAFFHSWRCLDRDDDGAIDEEPLYEALRAGWHDRQRTRDPQGRGG